MYRLFEFFYQYRAFLFFVLLETVSIWLIVSNNNYQGAAFFNSSNRYVGNVLEVKSNVQSYFELKQVNRELASENARLRQLLTAEQQKKYLNIPNNSDFLRVNKYYFIPARVINNSTGHFTNYITLDKGTLDGVKEGMGIISSEGVVGRIKKCSDHYSTAFSLLHDNLTISGKLKSKTKYIECNVKWDRRTPHEAALLDITRQQKIAVGDTVFTSGYDSYFPEGIMIGKVKEFKMEGGSYWKASLDLSTDFTSLSFVYIIGNKLEAEQDSLQHKNDPIVR
ncbi:MAG: rod shape-determining protein MreC [Cytophagaceae bacterium]|nr:rod shape-determining protein MreC [Cytophagaceae bacterium]